MAKKKEPFLELAEKLGAGVKMPLNVEVLSEELNAISVEVAQARNQLSDAIERFQVLTTALGRLRAQDAERRNIAR